MKLLASDKECISNFHCFAITIMAPPPSPLPAIQFPKAALKKSYTFSFEDIHTCTCTVRTCIVFIYMGLT